MTGGDTKIRTSASRLFRVCAALPCLRIRSDARLFLRAAPPSNSFPTARTSRRGGQTTRSLAAFTVLPADSCVALAYQTAPAFARALFISRPRWLKAGHLPDHAQS